jgi:hypothetical protein
MSVWENLAFMTHDVFISYSVQDKNVADAICAALENRKIRCWIAPRDILPGENFSSAIIKAINNSRIFVLVFSKNSNNSIYCQNEVSAALSRGTIIIPFKTEDVKPSESLEFLLGLNHWLDAITPPLEKHIHELKEVIFALLGLKGEPIYDGPDPKKRRRKAKPLFIIALVLASVLIIMGGLFFSGLYGPNNPIFSPTPFGGGPGLGNSSSQNILDFVPKDGAAVELNNGTKVSVPANGFVFVDYNKVIQGLPNGDEVVLFEDMNSFSVENSSILVAMKNGSTLNLTNYIFSSSRLYGYYTYTFLAPINEGNSNWAPSEIKRVTFDHTSDWQQPIPVATVATVSGQTFTAPSQTIIFDEVTSSLGPSHSWNRGLNIESGNFFPFSMMRRLEVNANSTVDNVMVSITTTNGDVFETTVKGDTYFYSYIYGMNQAGIFKLVFHNELKSIDFDWSP